VSSLRSRKTEAMASVLRILPPLKESMVSSNFLRNWIRASSEAALVSGPPRLKEVPGSPERVPDGSDVEGGMAYSGSVKLCKAEREDPAVSGPWVLGRLPTDKVNRGTRETKSEN
jgi:hypothetical protein